MHRSVVLGVLIGCGSGAPPAPAATAAPAPIAALNQRAGDATLDRNARCGAAFELFEKHLQPGVTAPAAAAVVTERAWIVVDDPVTVLGGEIPVELVQADSTFVVHCLATPNPKLDNMLWSDWVIYGRISGHTAETLRPFLAAGPAVTLIEYALVYPDGRIEQYRPSGRHSMHM